MTFCRALRRPLPCWLDLFLTHKASRTSRQAVVPTFNSLSLPPYHTSTTSLTPRRLLLFLLFIPSATASTASRQHLDLVLGSLRCSVEILSTPPFTTPRLLLERRPSHQSAPQSSSSALPPALQNPRQRSYHKHDDNGTTLHACVLLLLHGWDEMDTTSACVGLALTPRRRIFEWVINTASVGKLVAEVSETSTLVRSWTNIQDTVI